VRHRAYRGQLIYRTNGIGETGREWFAVTVQPDGTRTLRAQCEMDDDRLLRDVVLTCDAQWRPLDAFLRLSVEERTVGTSWFRFDGAIARPRAGRRSAALQQRFDLAAPAAFFGTHALHCDAWVAGPAARASRAAGELSLRHLCVLDACQWRLGPGTRARPAGLRAGPRPGA
jgi:hypothetical protein